MKQKVFISYSHADEAYMIQLKNHISMLKKEGFIEEWHDRKLIPGQEWDKEISENLISSTIIIMLISSDFLGSEYCFDIEMKKAMELHELKKAIVIPIIVRACDWARAPFSKLQALPKNALPVKKWDDEDDAWLDVAKGLKKTIDTFFPILISSKTNEKTEYLKVRVEFERWLQDTEVLLTHRRVSKVLLSDIYVDPDIRTLDDKEINDTFQIMPALNIVSKKDRYLIFGEEQQGKTSILKQAFKELHQKGLVPIIVQGQYINTADIDKILFKAVKKQYEDVIDLHKQDVIILIDDFSNIKINNKSRAKFLKTLNEKYEHIIITASKSFSYVTTEISEIEGYKQFDLLRFGHEKRGEITERWVSLGIEEQIPEETLYRESDELKSRLDSIIRGNIIPPKPIYVLMLLQMFEAYSQQNLELTNSGHCYQELIYQAFRQADIPQKEVGSYLNILTELAWTQHKNTEGLLENELDNFFDEYEKEYLKINRQKVKNKLQSNSILIVKHGRLQFKYPYLFYFFVAKKIAEGFSKSDEVRSEISVLLNELHREDYANILVFVTHHTKDDWILDEIQLTLMELFEGQEKADLSINKLSFMEDFLKEIPALVMEKREVSEERKKHNQRLDDIDETLLEGDQEEEQVNSSDLLAKINKTFKGIEIAGQIIRNRHASLSRESLYSLVEQGAGTGLRFLNFFISMSDTTKLEVVRSIEVHLREHPNLTNEQVQQIAESTFLHITYGVINGVMRKIASSIGSKEAHEIYDELEKTEGTPAVTLLNKAISMGFSKELDIEDIKKTALKFSNNAVCSRILRELVIQHTYMFPVEYKDKQRLSECLNISMHGQRLLDKSKEMKA